MNSRYMTFPVIVVLSLARPLGIPRSAVVAPPDFTKLTKSVLNVSAEKCISQVPQQASGFVWNKPDSVVTALHAVAGCENLSVKFGKSDVVWSAKVNRVLIKADLALLTITGVPALPAVSESNTELQPDQDLWTWGFMAGAPTPSEKKILKQEGAKTLRDFVGTDVAEDIKSSGMPSLDVEIIYVSGLVPGLSGAPIVDASGSVVGIGDGGLNGGSVGINWAIPQKYLSELLESTDNTAVVGKINVHQFSFDRPIPSGVGATLNCGGTNFRQVPDVNLADALRGTDAPRGLQQLMNAFAYAIGDPRSLTFSVYQDFSSGATFVLPTSANVSQGVSGCTAILPGTPITFTIELRHYKLGDLNDAISKRTTFDADTLSPFPAGVWNADPAWTTPPVIQPRFDDFAARRVGWIKFLQGNPQIGENVFTTTAIKRGTFLGIAAHTPSSYFIDPQVQACSQNPNLPGCQEVLQRPRNWGISVISVHLATFPIG